MGTSNSIPERLLCRTRFGLALQHTAAGMDFQGCKVYRVLDRLALARRGAFGFCADEFETDFHAAFGVLDGGDA
jgi:hypothetical protein